MSALIFGVLQFVSTFLIAWLYARYADRKFDPLADELRDQIEGAKAVTERASPLRPREHRDPAPGLTISLFALFVAITLGITIWASRQNRTAADFYAGGRSFTGMQNGFAIGGDYMSAASFLGIAGLIALYGYDGFLYSIGFLVAWLVALLLVAELMRNTGKFTMADVLASGCGSARCAPPRRSPPSSCRSSTCWPRWSAPARWSRCCSASRPATRSWA